jgi:hypothetical protein
LPRYFASIVHILFGLVERVEIGDTLVAVILSGPNLSFRTFLRIEVRRSLGVDNVGSVVDHDVTRSIPTSEAEIESSHKSNRFVDDTHLLVLFSDVLVNGQLGAESEEESG